MRWCKCPWSLSTDTNFNPNSHDWSPLGHGHYRGRGIVGVRLRDGMYDPDRDPIWEWWRDRSIEDVTA